MNYVDFLRVKDDFNFTIPKYRIFNIFVSFSPVGSFCLTVVDTDSLKSWFSFEVLPLEPNSVRFSSTTSYILSLWMRQSLNPHRTVELPYAYFPQVGPSLWEPNNSVPTRKTQLPFAGLTIYLLSVANGSCVSSHPIPLLSVCILALWHNNNTTTHQCHPLCGTNTLVTLTKTLNQNGSEQPRVGLKLLLP